MQDLPNDAESPAPAGQGRVAKFKPAVAQAVALDLVRRSEYPAGVNSDDRDLALTLQYYVRVFLKHKWLVLGTVLIFVSLGGLNALMKTPLYTSTGTIQIDLEAIKVVDGDTTAPARNAQGADFQRTHYELLKSRAMAERVVSSQQLQDDLDFLKPRGQSLTGWLLGQFRSKGDLSQTPSSLRVSAAVGIVASHVAVQPVAGSRLINLSFTDPNPQRAQLIANAYADAYVASNLDKRFEANSYAKIFLEDQIKQLKLRLEDSETALLAFAEREKIVQSSDKASIAENNLAAANAALGQLISERIKTEQAWRQVENTTGINLTQLLSNSVIDLLRGHRKELQREYQEKLDTFKPSYPSMIETSNKIKEIDRQLASEVATVKTSLEATYKSSLNQEREMKARIEQLRIEVLDLQKFGFRQNILTREVETNRGLYNSLLQRYKEVDIASGVGTNNIFIVDRALAPGGPSEPNINRILMLSLMLGLGMGVGFAFILELFDDYVRSPDEIEQIFGLSTLGIIPLLDSEQAVSDASQDPRSPISEAYRSLATALQFSTGSGLPRSIVVTSAAAREGKSTTSLAIARHFATMGSNVLLVDADLRKPSLHLKLGKDNSRGLSNYLTGAATPPELVQQTDIKTLAFIASGPLPPNAGDLLGGTRIFSMISVGLEVFDLIVVDSPPMLGIADAQLLASAAAATVFVVSAGQSRKGMVQSALRRLQLARITPIGVVLTKFDSKAAGYGYGYGYGYGHNDYTYGAQPEVVDGCADQPKIAAYGGS
jgi:succinoglycan biosynthesis transport protein ExoP